jgi:hypothetical protein
MAQLSAIVGVLQQARVSAGETLLGRWHLCVMDGTNEWFDAVTSAFTDAARRFESRRCQPSRKARANSRAQQVVDLQRRAAGSAG